MGGEIHKEILKAVTHQSQKTEQRNPVETESKQILKESLNIIKNIKN